MHSRLFTKLKTIHGEPHIKIEHNGNFARNTKLNKCECELNKSSQTENFGNFKSIMKNAMVIIIMIVNYHIY